MADIILVRHGQASFGSANYDVLSDTGHRQAKALGAALAAEGVRPTRLVRGDLRRHRETLDGVAESLGISTENATIDAGLDEFAFQGLMVARFGFDGLPDGYANDRRSYFAALGETVLMWQRGELVDPPEPFETFAARVSEAFDALAQGDGPVLAVTSGGPIAFLVARLMGAPHSQMLPIQMQIKNCSLTRFMRRDGAAMLHTFNETPHINAQSAAELLTYA
ncbi:MAG: histidine phosphatase family protein [Pseudomonadota bacterium]